MITFKSLVAAAMVFAAVIFQFKWLGLAITALNAGLIISYAVWRLQNIDLDQARERILPIYLIGIAVQCLHLGEEYLTGFQTELPAMFGYQWSDQLFVSFNLIWLAVFVLAAVGMHYRWDIALLVVWFFTLMGGIGNGIAHPALSLMTGGYFPGLITSIGSLIIGILLLRELIHARVRSELPESLSVN